MVLVHSDPTKKAMANAVRAAITLNCHATTHWARVVLSATASSSELATIMIEQALPFQADASSTGVITMDNTPVPEDANATGASPVVDAGFFRIEAPPTAGTGNIKTVAGVEILRGTVAITGGDLNMSSVAINPGDAVRINSLTWTSPA
jgi:hypothetical protein